MKRPPTEAAYEDLMTSLFGLALVVASVPTFWFFLQKQGKRSQLLDLPFMSTLVPLAVISAFAIGVTMVVSLFWAP